MKRTAANGIAPRATWFAELMGSLRSGNPLRLVSVQVSRREGPVAPDVSRSDVPPNDSLVVRVTTVASQLRGHQLRYVVFKPVSRRNGDSRVR